MSWLVHKAPLAGPCCIESRRCELNALLLPACDYEDRPFPLFTFSVCLYYCHTSSTPHTHLPRHFIGKWWLTCIFNLTAALSLRPVFNADVTAAFRQKWRLLFLLNYYNSCTFGRLWLVIIVLINQLIVCLSSQFQWNPRCRLRLCLTNSPKPKIFNLRWGKAENLPFLCHIDTTNHLINADERLSQKHRVTVNFPVFGGCADLRDLQVVWTPWLDSQQI